MNTTQLSAIVARGEQNIAIIQKGIQPEFQLFHVLPITSPLRKYVSSTWCVMPPARKATASKPRNTRKEVLTLAASANGLR
eukprot:CAMPEP_0180659180 /NCGR_PEP_ID=MMETSP1037_2-20121125/57430_1 /TAXON_ID=632150 /ORGANISM="Azadinium spinosum, Strain 3D9" /LENGTH=80 /DNA_ID=CAMNT_0022686177 /DNA_START=252 /DNA_END=494 /DNA_ORIENTATION=-